MAGVPLASTAFLSKEMFFTETLEQNQFVISVWVIPLGSDRWPGNFLRCPIRCALSHDVFFNAKAAQPAESTRRTSRRVT